MSRVALIHPPGTDPRSPRLALPTLAAYLRREGIATALVDLDLESLEAVLSRESLEAAGRAVVGKPIPAGGAAEEAGRIVRLADILPSAAPAALATLRDPYRFYDANARTGARETLLDALDLLSAASPRPVHYSLEPLRYEVDGFDATRLFDLVRVTADRGANLFADVWEAGILRDLDRTKPDVVGISIAIRFQLVPALMLARSLRERGHFVVLGGSQVQRFSHSLARLPEFFDYFADGVVSGDGETALVELLSQLGGGHDLARVPNFVFRDGGLVRFTRTHLEDVARLPTPDFDGLPLGRYLTPDRVLPLLVGRGCYWGECRFCEIPHNNRVSEQPYRCRRPETVVDDILRLAERFDCRHFVIGDEAVPPRTMEAIADGLAAAGRDDLNFTGYLRFERGFTPGVVEKLRKMGLRRALFGLESGSQGTLDHMQKGVRLEAIRPILESLRSAGIRFLLFALVGLPEESEESVRETFAFFEKNADLFDAPGFGFDIRPMELLINSPYMKDAASLGLRFDPELVSGDFPVGVGLRWENTRGVTREETDRLFRELSERLGAVPDFSGSYLWPCWEEWALLYAVRYPGRTFPFRGSLRDDPGRPVRLRWNPAAAMWRENAEVLGVASRAGSFKLDEQSSRALVTAGPEPAGALVRRLAGDDGDQTAVHELIEALVRARLLEIVPETGDSGRATGPATGEAAIRTLS